jgi:DNA-binding response OmpR family regulator
LSNSSQVLVVAPDRGLRRSLEFALEVEGFVVVSFEDLTAALASPRAAEGTCVVIDEDALLNDPLAMTAVRRFNKPAFLLIDRTRSVPESLGIRVLRKPVLGNALITAVKAAETDRTV